MAVSPDFVVLAYRPDLHLFVNRWLREVEPVEMRRGYELSLAQARIHGARFWLFDIRRRNNADPTTSRWITEEFMPALAAELGGQVSIAYLLSPVHLRRVDSTPQDLARVEQMRRTTNVALFIDEGEAVNWLAQQ